MSGASLATTLLAKLPVPAGDLEQLEALLERLVTDARAEWPALRIETEAFLAYLAERLPGESIADELEGLRAADLYLACACATGDRIALQGFEDRFMPDVDVAMNHARMSHLADEVKQQLRIKLFTTDGDSAPRIAEYSGRGDLRSWLRITAVRTALNIARGARREVGTDDDRLLDVPVSDHDPELDHLKARYRTEFREAVEHALRALEPRDRTLLRQYYLDGSTYRELATIYNVHLATAGRWVEKARFALFSRTREFLVRRLGLDSRDIDSVLRLIHSQLEVSAIELMRSGH